MAFCILVSLSRILLLFIVKLTPQLFFSMFINKQMSFAIGKDDFSPNDDYVKGVSPE